MLYSWRLLIFSITKDNHNTTFVFKSLDRDFIRLWNLRRDCICGAIISDLGKSRGLSCFTDTWFKAKGLPASMCP